MQQMSPQMLGGQFPMMNAEGSYAGMYPPTSPYPQGDATGGGQADAYGQSAYGGGMKGGKGKGSNGGKGRGFGGKGGWKGGGYGGYGGGGYGGYGGGYGGNYSGGGYGSAPNFAGAWTPESAAANAEVDTTRQIEIAQRRAKFRERSAISQAQRSAQMRFEKDLLDRVQGNWIDESDNTVGYVVEGSMCTVSGGENARVFRNRISLYNGELCWDARRWWHKLNITSLPPGGAPVERVEWMLGEGSPMVKDIVWIRGEPPALMPVMVGEAPEHIQAERVDEPEHEEQDVFAMPPGTA